MFDWCQMGDIVNLVPSNTFKGHCNLSVPWPWPTSDSFAAQIESAEDSKTVASGRSKYSFFPLRTRFVLLERVKRGHLSRWQSVRILRRPTTQIGADRLGPSHQHHFPLHTHPLSPLLTSFFPISKTRVGAAHKQHCRQDNNVSNPPPSQS